MNWKNIKMNPPADRCTLVTARRGCNGEYYRFKIYDWDAEKKELTCCRVTGYELIPFDFIPDQMYYINLDEIK